MTHSMIKLLSLLLLYQTIPGRSENERLPVALEIDELRKAEFLKADGQKKSSRAPNSESEFNIIFRKSFQADHEDLPVLKVNTDPENITFTKVDLEAGSRVIERILPDKKIDYTLSGFRFTTPPEGGPFFWSANLTSSRSTWYIVPMEGPLRYSSWLPRYSLSESVPGVGQKGERFLIYRYNQGYLEPDTEYMLVFETGRTSQTTLSVSLNVFPENFKYASYLDIFPMIFPEYMPPE